MLELYNFSQSACSQKVCLCLAEKKPLMDRSPADLQKWRPFVGLVHEAQHEPGRTDS